MNAQMHILYLTSTGHVLNAFTRTAEPASPETAPDLFIGADGLHLRGVGLDSSGKFTVTDFNAAEFVVAATDLALASMDLDPAVIDAPQSFQYDPNAKSFNGLTGSVTIDGTKLPASIDATVPTVSAPLAVAILIQGAAQARAMLYRFTITSTTLTTLSYPSLVPGNYDTVVFVQGYPPNYRHFKSP
jgi:hypothetical protein